MKTDKQVRIKKEMPKGWWKLALAIVMAGVGIAVCLMGNQGGDPIIISIGFFLLLGGVLLFISRRDEVGARILPSKKKLKVPANVLAIYPGEIEFDYLKNPPGHQLRCINDGKWYSVLIGNPGEKLQEFLLPDDTGEARHYDPREFANPVTMPANQKLFEPTPNLMKTIAVGVMGIAVSVLGIVIIAMSGG